MKDLYAYATMHGPLMLSELGFIAHQLLWKIRDLHRSRIILKFLAPQYIVISDGFDKGVPRLEITGVDQMILADSVASNRASDLSGVNLLFLAPEYFNQEFFDGKVDIWSVGVILYLLITDGVNPELTGDHTEHFNLMEPIWNAMDSYVTQFIQMMIQKDPEDRASIDELFESEFIRRLENRMLDNWIISRSLSVDPEPRLLKFYAAYLVNDILLRQVKSMLKRQIVAMEWPGFIEKRKKERAERQRSFLKDRRDGKLLPENAKERERRNASDEETEVIERENNIKVS